MELPNPEREFKPKMLASMLIKGKPQKRLTLPAQAVVREENRDYVFVRTGENAYRLQPVQLGAEYDGRRVVLSGLGEGETHRRRRRLSPEQRAQAARVVGQLSARTDDRRPGTRRDHAAPDRLRCSRWCCSRSA